MTNADLRKRISAVVWDIPRDEVDEELAAAIDRRIDWLVDLTRPLVAEAYEETARLYVTTDEPLELDEPTIEEQAYQEGFADALHAYRAKIRSLTNQLVSEPVASS